MSFEIDSREVLKYLNELGYYNVSSKQLKEFIRDLKTLIKYDQKKACDENQENLIPRNIRECHCESDYAKNTNNNEYIDAFEQQQSLNKNEYYLTEVSDYLHSSSTVSSRAKSVSKQRNIISVEITKHKDNKPSNLARVEFTRQKENILKPAFTNLSKKSEFTSLLESVQFPPYLDSKRKKQLPCKSADAAESSKNVNNLKPKVSFIRPRRPLKTCKSDPVLLYQQYQEKWKKQKLPGEDKHFDLRWAIRERMLGNPDIQPFPSTELSRKSSKF